MSEAAPLYLLATPQWVWGMVFWCAIATIIVAIIWGARPYRHYFARLSQHGRIDLDPVPDISVRDAFRHLMLDAKWSIGRYVKPNEKPAANSTGGQLYGALEAEMRDKVRAGRLRVWARPQVTSAVGIIQTQIEIQPSLMEGATFDLITCMGVGKSARIIDYNTEPWTVYDDVVINKEQMHYLWPKANWIDKKRDKTYKGRLTFFNNELEGDASVARQIPKP